MIRYIVLGLLFYFLYKYVKYLFGLSATTGNAGPNEKSDVSVNFNSKKPEKKFSDGEYIEFEEVE